MTWISKSLTLDLLAIGIDCLQRTFDRINAEDDNPGQWPPSDTPPAQDTAQEPQSQPDPTPTPEPAAPAADNTGELLAQAQNVLRAISLDEGPTWITSTLFPKYGVKSLTDVTTDNLPNLIADAQAHADDKQAA